MAWLRAFPWVWMVAGTKGVTEVTTFDDRERAFENKFAREQEVKFQTLARRNKLLGLWAADVLGHREEAATAYAQTLVQTVLSGDAQGEEALLERLTRDLETRVSPAAIRDKIAELSQQAMAHLSAPSPTG